MMQKKLVFVLLLSVCFGAQANWFKNMSEYDKEAIKEHTLIEDEDLKSVSDKVQNMSKEEKKIFFDRVGEACFFLNTTSTDDPVFIELVEIYEELTGEKLKQGWLARQWHNRQVKKRGIVRSFKVVDEKIKNLGGDEKSIEVMDDVSDVNDRDEFSGDSIMEHTSENNFLSSKLEQATALFGSIVLTSNQKIAVTGLVVAVVLGYIFRKNIKRFVTQMYTKEVIESEQVMEEVTEDFIVQEAVA